MKLKPAKFESFLSKLLIDFFRLPLNNKNKKKNCFSFCILLAYLYLCTPKKKNY